MPIAAVSVTEVVPGTVIAVPHSVRLATADQNFHPVIWFVVNFVVTVSACLFQTQVHPGLPSHYLDARF